MTNGCSKQAKCTLSTLYVRNLVSAFLFFDIEDAIELAAYAKEVYPVAELLYIMLKSLAGKEDREEFTRNLKRDTITKKQRDFVKR